MRIRIDTPLRTSHIRATAVLSKTQRAYSECEREGRTPGSEITFPDDSFSDRNPPSSPHLANSRWTMRSTRSLKTVAARGVGCSLAERTYSFLRGVARNQGTYFETMRRTPLPDSGVVTTARGVPVMSTVSA